MPRILLANNYLHCEDFSGSIKIDTDKNQMSIFNIKLQSSIQIEKTKTLSVKERIQEPFLEDYCDDIPEISREIVVYSGDEEVKRIPAGSAIPRVLKPLQKAVLSRKEKTEKRKIEIREGLIKYLKSKGGKHVISCNCSDKSTTQKKSEVADVHKFTGCKDAKSIRRERNSLVESGVIRQINSADKTVIYELVEQKKEKARSVCQKCGSFSLIRNENKYSSDEDYYRDKNGSYFTCLMCGEEIEIEEELPEAA